MRPLPPFWRPPSPLFWPSPFLEFFFELGLNFMCFVLPQHYLTQNCFYFYENRDLNFLRFFQKSPKTPKLAKNRPKRGAPSKRGPPWGPPIGAPLMETLILGVPTEGILDFRGRKLQNCKILQNNVSNVVLEYFAVLQF